MNVQNPEKHLFSIFWPDVSNIAQSVEHGQRFKILDATLIHRISRVLRLKPDEPIIFFDRSMHIICSIDAISKASLTCVLIEKTLNIKSIRVRVFLPVLKKDALEQAIYGLVEIGASDIILMETEKSYGTLYEKDMTRLYNIVLAAAEQSKNFSFPEVTPPQSFATVIDLITSMHQSKRFMCDAYASQKMMECIDMHDRENQYMVAIGPEADFTQTEKSMLRDAGCIGVRLTDTILRAQDAAFLAVGILRHMLF